MAAACTGWFSGSIMLLALALLAAPAAHAAVTFDPALWNSFSRYEASSIPADLIFPGPNAAASGPPLFPVDFGWDVEATCFGPSRPFPNSAASRAPGACEYEPTVSKTYTFWQKLPSERLRLANCYCYATDHYEGGWCYPGIGGGMRELRQDTMACDELSQRVVADGGVKASREDAVSGAVPSEGHFIALLFRPMSACNFAHCGPDFHLLRRDSNGRWSQKTGDASVTDKDADGNVITDPQATHLDGSYTDFCGYFLVNPSKMRIGSESTPDRISNIMQRWKDAGLQPKITQLPYDPSSDFIDEAARARQRQAMQRLQQGSYGSSGTGSSGSGDGSQQSRRQQQEVAGQVQEDSGGGSSQQQQSNRKLLRGA